MAAPEVTVSKGSVPKMAMPEITAPVARARSERRQAVARLVLDVLDARTGELIWRGWATKSLDDNPTPETVQKYVKAAVEKILEKFPPASLGPQPRHIAP